MAGIEDLTNMMMTGTRTDVPPVQGPPVAAGGPPPMAGPVSMGEPRMAPMKSSMSIEGDANALAQAVVGRTNGDIESARAVLAQADMILAQAGDRQPRMAADGGELKAVPEDNPGLGKLPEEVRNRMGYKSMGGPLYAAEGREISDKDADLLRQMISAQDLVDGLGGQSGRTLSEKDRSELAKRTNILQNAYDSARESGQSGKTLSDEDLRKALESMRNYRRN